MFKSVETFLEDNGFLIASKDETRPWGGFYVIQETQAKEFITFFFNKVVEVQQNSKGKISPKILIVEPKKRLSWQYHHRRAEIWKIIGGKVDIVTSNTDEQGEPQTKKKDEIIILKQGERHRLIGTNTWGIIAEIWQHTDPNNPSNEQDIVRIQDDFGR